MPAWEPIRVVAGHGPETAGLAELLPRIASFYQRSASDDDRTAFIQEQKVNYLIHGPRERDLGDWDPGDWNCLELVASQGEYDIFQTCTP